MKRLIYFTAVLFFVSCKNESTIQFNDSSKIQIGGILGKAIDLNMNGRLKNGFIQDETSEAIRIYNLDSLKGLQSEDFNGYWRAEATGKWMIAAAHAVKRTNDNVLKNHIKKIADFLVSQQGSDGYLGVRNDSMRFTGSPKYPHQTYDLWISGYLMEGLIEINKVIPDEKYIIAAKKIGDLCINTFQKGSKSVVNSGPFGGMGSASVLTYFVDLYNATKEKKYLDFAELCLQELEKRPGSEIITRTLNHYDPSQMNGGKMYEMLLCYVGIAKLYETTHNPQYLQVCKNMWDEVYNYHQNAAGAPCGGVDIHWECFNLRYMFSPYFRSETCAMKNWLWFTIEMLKITGEPIYADQIEKIAYNALIGAQFADGFGWQYHSIMNGRRDRTSQFACCSNSGTISLEEIPQVIYSSDKNGIFVNIYSASKATLNLKNNNIEIEQATSYPFDGKISIKINPEKETKFSLFIRIPSWIENSAFTLNGNKVKADASKYYEISQSWKKGSVVEIEFPITLRTVEKVQQYNFRGEYMDGKIIFISIYNGPLLYGTEWKDCQDKPNPLSLPKDFSVSNLKPVPSTEEVEGQSFEFETAGFKHLLVPYYEVAGRQDTSYHATWLKIKE
jgi:uncharacterized protein